MAAPKQAAVSDVHLISVKVVAGGRNQPNKISDDEYPQKPMTNWITVSKLSVLIAPATPGWVEVAG